MAGDKYSYLPQAPQAPHDHVLDDDAFDAEVDRDPYEWQRSRRDPDLGRWLLFGTGAILVGIVVVLGVTALILW